LINHKKWGATLKKMIVVDLDSTLLRTDKTVSDYTVSVLNQCKNNGHMVVFATARSEHDCTAFTDVINPQAIISNRGAIVRFGEDIIHRAMINIASSNDLLEKLVNHPNVGFITVFTEKGYHVNIPAENHDPTWGEYDPSGYTDFSEGIECNSYKISAEIFDDAVADEIASDFPELHVVRFTGGNWYSFANKSVNKWDGVKTVVAYAKFDLRNIVAFGDDYSDIEMIRECSLGIAVGNAIDEVKSVANIICDTNDNDGVAKWLEDNIL